MACLACGWLTSSRATSSVHDKTPCFRSSQVAQQVKDWKHCCDVGSLAWELLHAAGEVKKIIKRKQALCFLPWMPRHSPFSLLGRSFPSFAQQKPASFRWYLLQEASPNPALPLKHLSLSPPPGSLPAPSPVPSPLDLAIHHSSLLLY